MVRHWNRWPRKVVKSQILDMLKKGVEVALEEVVQQ